MSWAAWGCKGERTITRKGDFLVIAIVPIDRKRSAGITITIFTKIGNCIINLQSPFRHPRADTYIAVHDGQGGFAVAANEGRADTNRLGCADADIA